MHGFYIENRTLPVSVSLSRDLAQHIFTRGTNGSAVIIAERPHDLASITKKQWFVLIRQVQRERSSTLKAERIGELSDQIAWMQRLSFTAKLPKEFLENSVVFVTIDEIINRPPICSTLYITSPINQEQFHLVTSWLPKNGVVVVYKDSFLKHRPEGFDPHPK